MDDNARGGQPVGCEEVHVDGSVGQNTDDNATYGQTIGSEDVHMDEPNWLDEGYEELDYLDDIFGEPCVQNNEVPNMREHQRETKKVNEGEHLKEQVTNKGKPVIKLLMMMIGLKRLLMMMTLGALTILRMRMKG